MPPHGASLPSSPAVATGRLGRIHTRVVVDDAIGAMLGAAERVDVASQPLAVALRDALSEELDQWTSRIDHVNVFQYDTARVVGASSADASVVVVELLATRAVAKHLYGVVREFGRLHASATRHFMKAVVAGLGELHRHGLFCGGLALSNLFLSEGRVQIGAWFPPVAALQRLQEPHATMFTDNPFAQSVFRRHGSATTDELCQRDIQSLAFLVIEMLTGSRVVLSHLINQEDLLRPLPTQSMERAFVLELLQPTASIKSLQTHPYLVDDRVPHHPALAAGGSVTNTASQRELIAHLIAKELAKCREVQRTDAQQVRAWFAQFEKKFHRKPQTDERPASIQRLQQRCRVLHERIQELERRAKVLGHAAQSTGQLVMVPPDRAVAATPAESAPRALSHLLPSVASALDIDTSTGYGHSETVNDLVDQRRRSPAQNAFLRNLSHETSTSKLTEAPPQEGPPQDDAVQARDRGHELLHQRKEVMGVILGLEKES